MCISSTCAADRGLDRIEELLQELRREVTAAVMAGKITSEALDFAFAVPHSKTFPKGAVMCVFRARPVSEYRPSPNDLSPRLVGKLAPQT
jgi:hypothetical protein